MKFLFLVQFLADNLSVSASMTHNDLVSLGLSIQTLAIGIPQTYVYAIEFIKLLIERKKEGIVYT